MFKLITSRNTLNLVKCLPILNNNATIILNNNRSNIKLANNYVSTSLPKLQKEE